jgi:hypothetical protein
VESNNQKLAGLTSIYKTKQNKTKQNKKTIMSIKPAATAHDSNYIIIIKKINK